MDERTPYSVEPVTAERWPHLAALFEPQRVTAGCWCMWWRQPQREFQATDDDAKRQQLEAMVRASEVPGLLAYRDGEPVGWVSVAPREQFSRIERSRTFGPIDDLTVWSVVCFFIARRHRRAGVSRVLLDAAVRSAAERGAAVVEGYPVDTAVGHRGPGDVFTGTLALFRDAGFDEVARRSPSRPIVRRSVR